MIQGIGHIGILVTNIESVLEKFCLAFELNQPQIRDVKDREIKVAVLEFSSISLEFIEDYSSKGTMSQIASQKGNIIHHIAMLSDHIEADMAALEEKGFKMIDKTPRVGLRGKKIAFIDADLIAGIPIEITEP